MAFKIPYLAIINISIFLISITLITLSAITIYWTDHAIRNWDFSYWTGYWYRGPWRDPETKHLVNLIYESLNENMIFASCGITIVAALAAIVGYFVTRNTKPTILKSALAQFFPAVAFIFTLISIIVTSVHHTNMSHTSCFWVDGYIPDFTFTCTRELGTCRIVGLTTQDRYQNPTDTCVELHRARTMLIPLTVLNAVLFALGVARMYVLGRKESVETEIADERVERLQRDDE